MKKSDEMVKKFLKSNVVGKMTTMNAQLSM